MLFYFRIKKLMLLGVVMSISGCLGEEVLVIENEEVMEMFDSPDDKFKPLPQYTVSGITLLPIVIRDIGNDKVYFGVRAYTKDINSIFEIEEITVTLGSNKIPYVDTFLNRERKEWRNAFDGWSYKTERVREYKYSDLKKLELDKVQAVFNVVVESNGEIVSELITYDYHVSMRRYSKF